MKDHLSNLNKIQKHFYQDSDFKKERTNIIMRKIGVSTNIVVKYTDITNSNTLYCI